MSTEADELGDEGLAEEVISVQPFLGETPDPDRQRRDFLLESRLPAQVPFSICNPGTCLRRRIQEKR